MRILIGVLGGMIYASAGAVMGSMNAGWFGLDREANAMLPWMGVGAALVVFAFSSSKLHAGLRDAGRLGPGRSSTAGSCTSCRTHPSKCCEINSEAVPV